MYCRKEMVEISKCYLIPKKFMALCLRVQFFLANLVEQLLRDKGHLQNLCNSNDDCNTKFRILKVIFRN